VIICLFFFSFQFVYLSVNHKQGDDVVQLVMAFQC
jgi:hypothetical protein